MNDRVPKGCRGTIEKLQTLSWVQNSPVVGEADLSEWPCPCPIAAVNGPTIMEACIAESWVVVHVCECVFACLSVLFGRAAKGGWYLGDCSNSNW